VPEQVAACLRHRVLTEEEDTNLEAVFAAKSYPLYGLVDPQLNVAARNNA
jgi:hypothetical protein